MAQGGQNSACEVERDVLPMSHDVFDVVSEDPEIQHIPNEMHPAAMEEHACDQRGVRRNSHAHLGRISFAEHEGWDRPILKNECFSRAGGKTCLVEKDKNTGRDSGDRDHRSPFGRVVVVQRDHGAFTEKEACDDR